MLLVLAGAIALRIPKLETRPLHNDEAVNAVTVAELWQHGRYAYDPNEYHGPVLHYATLPFLWLSGARNADELPDSVLRIAPVVFGTGLILLLLLFSSGLGRHAVVWAALFTALSPAMVFYSRYFIHEMLLVFFSVLAIGAGWHYRETPSPGWALAFGAAVGLMFATKETFVLSLAAIVLAAGITAAWGRIEIARGAGAPMRFRLTMQELPWKHLALAGMAAVLMWLLFFSSFFTHFSGLADSVRTYLPWLKRAGGHSPHIHPWSFYFERLAWFHPVKGPTWSEGLVLILATVGIGVSLRRRRAPLHRFLVFYTVILTGIYCAISYKTPWCMLNFYCGMILLAGVGAATLVEVIRPRIGQAAMVLLLLGAAGQLGWQAWRASFVYAADRKIPNPYIYAQTVPDILNLVDKVEGISKVAPAGHDTIVKVIGTDGDYWPLPWYLRRFKHVGWYDDVPADPFAPIVVVSAKYNSRLDDKSGKKWILAQIFELRPRVFLELYVELELWKKYVETLPRERDE